METKCSKSYLQTKHKKCNMYNNIQNIAVTFVVTIFVLRGNKEPNCSIVNLLRFESFFCDLYLMCNSNKNAKKVFITKLICQKTHKKWKEKVEKH